MSLEARPLLHPDGAHLTGIRGSLGTMVATVIRGSTWITYGIACQFHLRIGIYKIAQGVLPLLGRRCRYIDDAVTLGS